MAVAYFDCFSGISGDMILGAFIDVGLPLSHLRRELAKLKIGRYKIVAGSKRSGELAGTNLHVEVTEDPGFSRYSEIKKVIGRSRLSKRVKDIALEIFSNLARAEAKVHGRRPSDIHFHELGGVDSIIDIVGAAVGADYFGFEKVYSSPLPLSRGYVKCAHGTLPVPAPATLELIKGIPVETTPVKGEIVTPTGAAVIKVLANGFGSSPLRRIDKVGYGFGDKRIPGRPNALRLLVGEGYPLVVVETNIDDMNPEFYPDVIGKILNAGAIDAGIIPMVMKKGRPGALVQVLCEEKDRKKIIKTIMNETTTFGVRYFPVEREVAERETKKVKTRWGTVRVKVACYQGKTTTIAPEYADCQKIASKKNIPVKEVYRQAILKAKI